MDAFRAAVLADDGDAAYEAAVVLARGVLIRPEARLALQVLTGDRFALDRGAELVEREHEQLVPATSRPNAEPATGAS